MRILGPLIVIEETKIKQTPLFKEQEHQVGLKDFQIQEVRIFYGYKNYEGTWKYYL